MKLVSLIVGIVLGFFIAAWFYGEGGALVVAGKQIGPDIVEAGSSGEKGAVNNPAVTGNSTPVVTGNSAPLSGGNSLPLSGGNVPPSGVAGNSFITVRWPK